VQLSHAPRTISRFDEDNLVSAAGCRMCRWMARWSRSNGWRPSNEHGHEWYSGKHKTQGGNVQIVADPTEFPVWPAPVEPGSVQDITAARAQAVVSPLVAPGTATTP